MSTTAAALRSAHEVSDTYTTEPLFQQGRKYGLPIMFDGRTNRFYVTAANGNKYFASTPGELKDKMREMGRAALKTNAYQPKRVAVALPWLV